MKYGKIVEGKFIDRPNRFIAHVALDGVETVCHVKNTGRCRELLTPDVASFYVQQPNFFGLSIAYDPYMREVVQADRLTTCGGDGGCNICGGLGPFLGFLPCSPHCKPEVQEDNELNGDYDFYRPIIRLENYD